MIINSRLKIFGLAVVSTLFVLSPFVQAAENMPLTSDNPVDYTPRIIGGWVDDPNKPYRTIIDFAKIGNDVYAGGVIDKVAKSDGTKYDQTFGNIIRFNSKTGKVDQDFHPKFKGWDSGDGAIINGVVNALAASPDGNSLFIGGEFISVDGKSTDGLVKWDLKKDKLDDTFKANLSGDGSNGHVYDVKYTHGQLLVGVTSTAKNDVLLSINPDSGKRTDYANISITDPVRPGFGEPRVFRIAVSPNNNRAVLVGDFRTIDGKERKQLAMVELGDKSVKLADWYARDVMRITTPPPTGDQTPESCGVSRTFCILDADWSPDGSWFSVAASGGPGLNYPSLKDSISRFENNNDGNNYPTWLNYSGGDTFHATRATNGYVYSGGHNKWLNAKVYFHGKQQKDVAKEEHSGLGAIDANTGRAVSNWNRGDSTERGEGWGGMLVVPGQGLWVGGDTDYIQGEPRNRLGLMPVK